MSRPIQESLYRNPGSLTVLVLTVLETTNFCSDGAMDPTPHAAMDPTPHEVVTKFRLGLENNHAFSQPLNNPSFSQIVRPKVFVSVSEKATRSSFVIIPS